MFEVGYVCNPIIIRDADGVLQACLWRGIPPYSSNFVKSVGATPHLSFHFSTILSFGELLAALVD